FLEVVEQASLTNAAAALHLTQPTLTRQIQQLEAQLGVPLFDRIGRRLVLNEAGESVYAHAKRLLAMEQALRDELQRFSDPEVGTIRIGAGVTPSIYLLPPVLSQYRAAHPGVVFDVRTGSSREVAAMVRARDIALGILTTLDTQVTDLTAVPLMRDPLVLVAAPGHPLLGAGAVHFHEAAPYPFVVMRSGSGLRQLVNELAGTSGWSPRIAMETDSLESSSRLVQLNAGLAVLPASCVHDDLRAGRLKQVPLVQPLPSRTLMLVRRKHGALPACAERFAAKMPALLQEIRGKIGPVEEGRETNE
ncbi:MAG: LysR family transcriptional regulator, partial [Alicyclobacillus sp.]|nr:LysR family transcriptional regulator [Alicyclobacillus sp.]